MKLFTALPLGDHSNSTMYLYLGIAAVCAIALVALFIIPKLSKKEKPVQESHIEEINEE